MNDEEKRAWFTRISTQLENIQTILAYQVEKQEKKQEEPRQKRQYTRSSSEAPGPKAKDLFSEMEEEPELKAPEPPRRLKIKDIAE